MTSCSWTRRSSPGTRSSASGAASGSRSCATCPGPGGDLAALRPGQLPHDVEPEPNAAEAAPVPGFTLDEPLEDALVLARRDADALVVDGDLDPLSGRPGGHDDRPAVRRVFVGVLQQLPDDDIG